VTAARARRIADAAIVVSGLCWLTSTTFMVLRNDYSGQNNFDVAYAALTLVAAGLYLWIARSIVTRQPSNTVGWILLGIPVLATFAFADGAYATRALVLAPGSLPFGVAAAWVDRWDLIPALAAFVPIFLLFPDGRLPSRRWRPALWLAIGGVVVAVVSFAITPGRLTGAMADLVRVRVANPLGLRSAAGVLSVLTMLGGTATFVAVIVAAVSLVVRFRRATGERRQQVRLLAAVGVAVLVEIALGFTLGGLFPQNEVIGNVLFLLLFVTLVLGVPIACGVAILRYRLYDLDVVIRKTVVIGLLAAFIAAVYAAIVGGVGALVGSASNPYLSFVAAATLAVGFQPARERARRVADRLVYGERATPYEVLADFSGRVGDAYATDDVLPRMAQLLVEGTGAASGTVWLRVGGELRPEASWPTDGRAHDAVRIVGDELPAFADRHATEVRDRGELLGALTVTMSPSDPIDPAREKLIHDLAAQAGLVLRNVRLIEEVRASRQRLVAAQDEERRRLERNLHDGAQQRLVALAVQLKLVEQLVARDPEQARELAGRVQAEATEALEELRELARGIYPPLLADQGLAAALGSQARKAVVPTTVEAGDVGRFSREVEAAVYFSVLEALNNVAKYAEASRAIVRLSRDDGHLELEVTDDGLGFDPGSISYGTGLQGIADRLAAVGGDLRVESSPGAGTTIRGTVPAGRDA